ncbi:MAG: hypothetical protein QW096_10375 [Thermofilaceae archaeon]
MKVRLKKAERTVKKLRLDKHITNTSEKYENLKTEKLLPIYKLYLKL